MEFDLFGERRSGHGVKGGGVSKRELLVGSRARESHNRKPDPYRCSLCKQSLDFMLGWLGSGPEIRSNCSQILSSARMKLPQSDL
jgi:hypothetical protein